ncbi:hypothetical protein BD779DRAFT_1577279 [Infundibulicybe gibba]|nr:hypothetical protein BD779DRAFT_1577279 [Infundibulicybe gibba]
MSVLRRREYANSIHYQVQRQCQWRAGVVQIGLDNVLWAACGIFEDTREICNSYCVTALRVYQV